MTINRNLKAIETSRVRSIATWFFLKRFVISEQIVLFSIV